MRKSYCRNLAFLNLVCADFLHPGSKARALSIDFDKIENYYEDFIKLCSNLAYYVKESNMILLMRNKATKVRIRSLIESYYSIFAFCEQKDKLYNNHTINEEEYKILNSIHVIAKGEELTFRMLVDISKSLIFECDKRYSLDDWMFITSHSHSWCKNHTYFHI